VGYLQFDIDTATEPPPNIQYVLADNNRWYTPYQDGENWVFDGTDWVIGTDIGGGSNSKSVKPSFDQNCVLVPRNAKGTITQRYCAVEKKLDGQLMTKFIPNMCKPGTGPAIAASCAAATFPAGSSAFDLTASVTSTIKATYDGMFETWVSDGSWGGYCTKEWDSTTYSCGSDKGTLLDFIKWNQFPNIQTRGDSCNTPFSIKSYNETTKKGQINWGSNPNLGCGGNYQFNASSVLETSDFEVVQVGGTDVLIVPTPAIFKVNNPSQDAPYLTFTVLKGSKGIKGVWSGSYYPVNFKQSIPFTGDPATNTQIINTVMFDAILKQKGITPYPYKKPSSSGTYNGKTSTDPN
jgi:hypothetical protein